MILKALVLKKFEFDKGNCLFQPITHALSKFVVVVMFFVYIINKLSHGFSRVVWNK